MAELLNEACRLSQKCYNHRCLVYLFQEYSDDTLMIAFKGTTTLGEAMVDMNIGKIDLGKFGKVHRGFYEYFTKVHRDRISDVLKDTVYNNIVFTGHSLGGAIATIASSYFGGVHIDKNVYCISFGAPRVGNSRFVKTFRKRVYKSFRFENKNDVVTNFPPKIFSYRHVDTRYVVNDDLFDVKAHKLEKYCPHVDLTSTRSVRCSDFSVPRTP